MKSYYFSHDFNAHSDVKVLFLRQQLGMEGYGIYWFIIESLAAAGGKLPLKILPVLALQMQTSEVKVMAVIKEFELFQVTQNEFFSLRLNKNLDNVNKIRKINSEKGKKSAQKRSQNLVPDLTAVEPRLNSGSTNKRKENKIQLLEFKQNTEIEEKNDFVQNVEEFFQKSESLFENVCMKTGKSKALALDELTRCHLHLEKKGLYPLAKKAAIAWFTSWLINSEDFNKKYLPSKAEKKSSEPPKKNIDEILKKYK